MTSREFVQTTDVFIKLTPPYEYLLTLLFELSESSDQIGANLKFLAARAPHANDVVPAHSKLIDTLRDVSERIRRNRESRKVWSGIEDLTRRLNTGDALNFAVEIRDRLGSQLSELSSAYEQFLKTYSPDA